MKQFIKQVILFPLVFVLLFIGGMYLTTWIVKNRDFNIAQTDSNTLVMGRDQHYNIILSGASHARVQSRDGNHFRVEGLLDKTVFNIAQGAASCGVQEQFFYLQYFYDEKNEADYLFYMLSPGLLFSETLPLASNTFNSECFSLRFLYRYMKFPYSENKSQRIFEYIRSKYSLDWILMKPNVKTENDNVLEKVDREAARKGVAMFYEVDETMDRFKISCELIEDEVKYAMAHNTRVVFIIPPSAFGEWPGHDLSLEFARRMQEKYGCEVYNYANAILDRQYYYDHHHLNSKGVTYFAEHCLKPILEDNSEN